MSALENIIDSLTDRRGLRHEWDNIDEEIKTEIKAEWAKFIADEMAAAVGKEQDRCYDIVSAARFGEVDQDFRAICHMIEGGRTIEELKRT